MKKLSLLIIVGVLLISACARPPEPPPVVEKPVVAKPVTEEGVPTLQPVAWQEVSGWQKDNPSLALGAFLKSCSALRWRPQWQSSCQEAAALEHASKAEVRTFFERNFVPHQVSQSNGSNDGLLTGYYVPDLKGSRTASADYPYPLYHRPDDLLVIDLSDLYPDLGNYRLRGRVEGNRVVPYWGRSDIDGQSQPLVGQELFWVADAVELFFLHIQGSGRIMLDNGERVMVNYADQNGHPYRSIGKYLIDRGAMSRDQMSMQNIRAWVRDNPSESGMVLNQNPSYVFFRELDGAVQSPPGALGVPLTPGRSLAVDRRYIPLGAPVFVETTWPNSEQPLQRLMMAQDTGGAIKGRIRGDFFWGMGDQAGEQAGRMKQPAKFWVFLPRVASTTN
ncbi:MAG: murein transglycosylase A [Desulfuromonadales bacterium]|nr:murein transglycosylase A [Desulfuromonadales bacterium]